ncbi:DEAD/DEAH box helicase family protein [Nitrosococcus halophilus]|uniref:DEAD/DEAH box helicase family protein n=1 Tax=Nitrosococcus halophilus TaxID=133539 RepID=UPI0002DF44F4|nr:DEAD/DEAH box helicase family protein [Nitrosococcus halophilus]
MIEQLSRDSRVAPLLSQRLTKLSFRVEIEWRGLLKQTLVAVGYPAEDLAGYVAGEPLPIQLQEISPDGSPFVLREYQQQAAAAFYQGGSDQGGSGVIVLPCGAGKTIVGLAAMAAVGENTLVLTTSMTSVQQWRRELLDKTDLPNEAIAEYSGERKAVGPVTLSTYQLNAMNCE